MCVSPPSRVLISVYVKSSLNWLNEFYGFAVSLAISIIDGRGLKCMDHVNSKHLKRVAYSVTVTYATTFILLY